MRAQSSKAPFKLCVIGKKLMCIKLSEEQSRLWLRETKNLIYKYLEDKWTSSYIDQLQSFVQIINSRVNRVSKLASNKITRKDVPLLISLSVDASAKLVRRPKFYVGDLNSA